MGTWHSSSETAEHSLGLQDSFFAEKSERFIKSCLEKPLRGRASMPRARGRRAWWKIIMRLMESALEENATKLKLEELGSAPSWSLEFCSSLSPSPLPCSWLITSRGSWLSCPPPCPQRFSSWPRK